MATVPGDPTATVRLPTGEEILITREFAESGERTAVAIRVRYGSQQDRDAHGVYMRDGLQEAMALLEQTAVWLLTGASGRSGEHPVRQAQPGARR